MSGGVGKNVVRATAEASSLTDNRKNSTKTGAMRGRHGARKGLLRKNYHAFPNTTDGASRCK